MIRIAGTGSAIPTGVVSTDFLGSLVERTVPGKGAAWAIAKLGIHSRHFLAPLDEQTGHPIGESCEVELAERAARAAIRAADLAPDVIGGLWYISCTQSETYRHFSRSVFELHDRLGLAPEAFALELDAGCAGAVYAMSMAAHLLEGGTADTVLIVAANAPSQYFSHWEAYAAAGAWLSMYIFGDGAGAVVLRRAAKLAQSTGILATYNAVDPRTPLMEFDCHGPGGDPIYFIDGRGVSAGFRRYARGAIEALQARYPFKLSDISRFYFHQVNGALLRAFISELDIPADRVPIHVDRYGNLAAASTLVLLDEDIRAGSVGPGDLCLLCAVGAGAQYGAMLVRL